MTEHDVHLLRAVFAVADRAGGKGNSPFGALLANEAGEVLLEAENTVNTESDCTCHAELNLVRMACKEFSSEFLAKCTIYASTEPCPMCSGAIYNGNIGRVVFGLSQQRRILMLEEEIRKQRFSLPCRELMARGGKNVEVAGPMLEDEATAVVEKWTTSQTQHPR